MTNVASGVAHQASRRAVRPKPPVASVAAALEPELDDIPPSQLRRSWTRITQVWATDAVWLHRNAAARQDFARAGRASRLRRGVLQIGHRAELDLDRRWRRVDRILWRLPPDEPARVDPMLLAQRFLDPREPRL